MSISKDELNMDVQSSKRIAVIQSMIEKRTMGDVDLMNILLTQFIDKEPKELKKLKNAIEKNDRKNTITIAHNLKGITSYFDNKKLVEKFVKIEDYANNTNFTQALELYEKAEKEFNELIPLVKKVIKEVNK